MPSSEQSALGRVSRVPVEGDRFGIGPGVTDGAILFWFGRVTLEYPLLFDPSLTMKMPRQVWTEPPGELSQSQDAEPG